MSAKGCELAATLDGSEFVMSDVTITEAVDDTGAMALYTQAGL